MIGIDFFEISVFKWFYCTDFKLLFMINAVNMYIDDTDIENEKWAFSLSTGVLYFVILQLQHLAIWQKENTVDQFSFRKIDLQVI